MAVGVNCRLDGSVSYHMRHSESNIANSESGSHGDFATSRRLMYLEKDVRNAPVYRFIHSFTEALSSLSRYAGQDKP
jgi:hypothetical protein